jgi:Thioesterase domain
MTLSQTPILDEVTSVRRMTAPGRGDLTSSRLEEHLHITLKRLKKLGLQRGECVASVLPEGPDATTVAMTVKLAEANFAPLPARSSREEYQALLLETDPKLLLLHSGMHPAREAARSLGIPIANVLRHFEAGIFTLETDIAPPWSAEAPPLSWKNGEQGVPVVLIAPGPAYRRLANRLDPTNPVVGITPPSLEHLALPHTIEHIAAECVRILRRYRPQGPYALAGWQVDGLVALEMARLLEEEGEKVLFVALLDASGLFNSPTRSRLASIGRAFFSRKPRPSLDFMAEALRQYRPQPWFGKILHLSPKGQPHSKHPGQACLEWRDIAPHGFASYEAPAEMLSEPNVQIVATILAAEMIQARKPK